MSLDLFKKQVFRVIILLEDNDALLRLLHSKILVSDLHRNYTLIKLMYLNNYMKFI